MRIDLAGRTALVAGGARGVGRGIVEALAEAGARIYIGDLRHNIAVQTAEELTADGHQVSALALDVTSEAQWSAAIEAVVAEAGGIDILTSSAGIFPRAGLAETTPNLWHQVLDTNCTSLYFGARAALPHMLAAGRGVIVSIGSVMSEHPSGHMMAYCVSKAALDMLVRCLALEHAKAGIRVCGVNPGWLDTEGEREVRAGEDHWQSRAPQHIPTGRLQTPREIGDAVCFLCSDQASSITGALLGVDGGTGAR